MVIFLAKPQSRKCISLISLIPQITGIEKSNAMKFILRLPGFFLLQKTDRLPSGKSKSRVLIFPD